MSNYYDKLKNLLNYNGHSRNLPAWQKAFKKEWKRCMATPLCDPDDPKYAMDA